MTLRRIVVLFASVAALVPFAQGCQAGGVGDPCTPEDEYQTTFSGFDAAELNIESRSFQCETRVCLVNHFRGRVSCPLGMSEDVLSGLLNFQAQKNGTAFPAPGLQCPQDAGGKSHGTMTAQGCVIAPDDPAVCRLPGESGKGAQTVQVTVNPQCTGAGTHNRTAGNAVYCSCRCAGDDPNANYCTCPSGYTCTELKEFAVGAAASKGSAQLKGSYCIKNDTELAPGEQVCPAKSTVAATQTQTDACKPSGNCNDSSGNKVTANP